MKLATERTGTADGRLLVVSRDLELCAPADGIARTLQEALEHWDTVEAALEALYERLNERRIPDARPLADVALAAPLPRAWQWLDGSVFPAHAELMQKAFDLAPIETEGPLMYQGMSHRFLSPTEDVPFPSEQDGIDFEGELGIITGEVPLGTQSVDAGRCIRLAVQINDWSLRRMAPLEMRTGFGFIHAKPACSLAPIAVTLDELESAWTDGRITAIFEVWRNGEPFGTVPATEAAYGFDDLIAHAARTRMLCAGTIIGSGTVSHSGYRQYGSCCIAERRAIEIIDHGAPATPFLSFGERVRMQARAPTSEIPLFGVIDQRVVRAVDPGTASRQ
ncbi:MAG TPA: fumarylacetoacetate hydrolase family protein [Gammaproteobacteria bacterium]